MTYYQKTISNLSLILFSLSLILMANYSFGANPESDPRQLWEPHASLFGGSTTLEQIESDDSPFEFDLPPLFESDIAQFGDSTEPFAYSHGALSEFDDPTIPPVTQLGRPALPDIAGVVPRQTSHETPAQSAPAVCRKNTQSKVARKIRAPKSNSEPFWRCPVKKCNFRTTNLNLYYAHSYGHEKGQKFYCETCKNYGTDKPKDMILHWITHTGEKPFKCTFDGCNYATKQKNGLDYHIASKHTSEKPFKCGIDGCNYTAAQKCDLTTHQKTHTNGGPHSCKHPGCKCCFISSNALAYHKKQHDLGQDAPMAGKRKRNEDTLTAKTPHKAVSFEPNVLISEDTTLHSPKRPRLQDKSPVAEKLIMPEEKREEKNDDESAISLHALIPNHEDTEASAAYEQDKFNDHGAPALPAIVGTDIDIADPGVIDEQTNFHLDEWSISPELLNNLSPKKIEDMTPEFDDPTILPVTQLGRQVLPDIAYVIPRQPSHAALTQSNPAVPVESVAPNPVQKTREKPFKCEVDGCKFATTQKNNLTAHRRTHTGEKPFKCEVDGCKFATTQKNNLTAHRRTHTGEKPFKCEVDGCKFAATEKRGLNYHIASKHTSEKPFKCGIYGCKFAATEKNSLTTHQKTHTNNAPRSCKHPGCKCYFESPRGLALHKKQHEQGQDAPMAGKRKRNEDTLTAKTPHKAVSFDPNALIPEDTTLHSPKRTRLQDKSPVAEKLIMPEEEREEEEREEKNDDESAISLHALIPNHEDTEASAAYEQDKFNDHGAPALPAIVGTDIDIADAGVIDEQTNFHLDEWSISPELLTNLPPKKLEDMTPDERLEWQIHIWDLETSRR